ncbi:MAG: hypothetical protein QOE70_985 [Chthoniobacter sp.]|jgi:predicted O-methyltransferase YrrM|nr:hypothetical protein [Chthoniobacter sp.]
MKRLESNKPLFVAEYLVALGAAAYLFTVGWLRRRHRTFIQGIAAYFGFRPRHVARELPVTPLAGVLPSELAQTLVEPAAADGNVTFLELCVLNEIVRQRQPAGIFELGTFDGRTTLNLAANTPADTRLWTIDLPASAAGQTTFALSGGERILVEKEKSGARFERRPEGAKISQLYGDTATFDFSPYFGKMDFVFIDASHAYEYVLNDSRIALQLLRDGKGTIIWHDYGEWIGVTGALNELRHEEAFKGLRWLEDTTLAMTTIGA